MQLKQLENPNWMNPQSLSH